MKKFLSKILAVCVLALALSAGAPLTPLTGVRSPDVSAAPAPVKIAFIGDSLTELGYSGHESFRVNLWKNLVDCGIASQFVGRTISNPPAVVADYKGQTFVNNHLAWGGKRIETIRQNMVANWGTASSGFDIAVIIAGHNDIVAWDTTPRPTLPEFNQSLKNLIASVRANSPNAKIILQTTPRTNIYSLPQTYIDEYQNVAMQSTTLASPVYYLPSPAGITAAADTFDGTHPNDVGNAKIAASIWSVLKGLVGAVDPTPTPAPTTPVTALIIYKSSATLKVGESLQIGGFVVPMSATNKLITWASSKLAVASVSATGRVLAKAAGTATITAKSVDGGFVRTCKITVVTLVASVKLNKSTASLKRGASVVLKATVSPFGASNKKVTWKSSNAKVAKVGANGVVKALSKGIAYVSVTTVEGKKSAKCKIIVH